MSRCLVCDRPWENGLEFGMNGRCEWCNRAIARKAAATKRANRDAKDAALAEHGKARPAAREKIFREPDAPFTWGPCDTPDPIEPAAGHLDPDCVLIPPTHPLRLPALPVTPFDFIVCDLDMVEDQPWAVPQDGIVWAVVGVPVNLEGA